MTAGGPVFFLTHSTIVFSVLPPLYSDTVPLRNHFKEGNPRTEYVSASSSSTVASTLINVIRGECATSVTAAFSYSGASALQ